MKDVKIIKANLTQHDFIYLVPLSDFHWDEPESDHEAIQGYVDWIARHKNAYTILNGDLVTAPVPTSQASVYEMSEPGGTVKFPSLDQCTNELTELFTPIADRILAACTGGHEFNHLFKHGAPDWTYNLMKGLGREQVYTRDGGMLLIKTKALNEKDNTIFKIVYTHGWGGARTRGAKVVKIERLSHAIHADVYVMSHDHTQNLARDNYLGAEWDKGITVDRKLFVSTGAFRGYSGYPFRGGYQPSDLGTPRVRLDKKVEDGVVRKDIHASI